MNTDTRIDPLAGLTVIDLTHYYSGPYATFLMAMAGAQVIKVEPPDGEYLRFHGDDAGPAALPFAMLNSNKQPITLDLKTESGRALFKQLVARADVLVENFAPGTMDRVGLGAAALREANPRLIYASSSGFGQDGPYRDHPGLDLTMQAMCGVIDSTGFVGRPPVKSAPALCDFLAGIHLYGAIVTALYERERSGSGRVVEVSIQDATYLSLASSLGVVHARGPSAAARTGNRHGGLGIAPYNVYRTNDGHVVLCALSDRHFHALLDVMGASDLKKHPRLATNAARVEYFAVVDELIEGWTIGMTRDDVARRMLAARVPCAPVRGLAEVIVDENMHARGSLQWVDHPALGRVVLPHSPLVFEGTPRRPIEPSLPLGAGNDDVLGEWLGHTPDEIAAFRAAGAFG
jgi:CoA:oxalate CoA-transferase